MSMDVPSYKQSFFWRILNHWNQKLAIFRFRKKVVEHCYCGEKLRVSIEDGLAKGWYDHDWGIMAEISSLSESRLKSGALVFDLGAHQGVVAMILARKVGQNGKVVAAEPIPHNFAVMGRNIELNQLTNIRPIQAAIGNKVGTLEFSSGLNGSAAVVSKYGLTQIVPMVTINSLVEKFGKPDVVFLDVEGFEALALSSAQLAFHGNCDFFVEVHVGAGLEKAGSSVGEILNYFPSTVFECHVHHDGGMN
jgi:FkbM family methyltransferase